MEKKSKLIEIFSLKCPCCRSILWIDPVSKEIIKTESPEKDKKSLEELLAEEKQKKEGMERKFQATAELEKEKLKKALEKFQKALDINKQQGKD